MIPESRGPWTSDRVSILYAQSSSPSISFKKDHIVADMKNLNGLVSYKVVLCVQADTELLSHV